MTDGPLDIVADIGAGARPTIIRPGSRTFALRPRELADYRELLFFFVWRDVKVRYKQTALGALWAVLQPFSMMIIFGVFLGHLAHVPSNGLPYPVFAYAALVPWTFFAQSLAGASDSLVSNANVVSKVYFPRLLLPAAAPFSFLLDFVIAFVLLIGMMAYYGIHPTLHILLLPLFVVLALVTALAIGLWLSALNVRYRDIRYAVPFIIQIWLFATPVAYPSTLVPHAWRTLYGLNPMAGVVEGFRWALLGADTSPGGMIAVSVAVVGVLLVGGLIFFQRVESTFADVI